MLPRVLSSFLAGLGLQSSLIVAIGPQNAFVLRQGLRREHVWPVVALCTAADVLLLTAGAGGVSAAACALPGVKAALRWGGAAWVGVYGLQSLLRLSRPRVVAKPGGETGRSARPRVLSPAEGAAPAARRAVLLQAAAFTFLNPHVYLDALILAGTVAASQPPGGASWFVGGASLASAAWFAGIGLAAQVLAPRLSRSSAWRWLDAITGIVMCLLALRLALG